MRGIPGFELLPAETAWQLSAPNHRGKVARAEREPTQQGTDSSPARSLSSTFKTCRWGHTSWQQPRPPGSCYLSRPTPPTGQQTVLSRHSEGSATSAPRADGEQESVPSLAHIVQMGKQSGEDTPLPHGPSVCTGAGIGIALKTLAGFVNLGRYHCRYSFETLKICWF